MTPNPSLHADALAPHEHRDARADQEDKREAKYGDPPQPCNCGVTVRRLEEEQKEGDKREGNESDDRDACASLHGAPNV